MPEPTLEQKTTDDDSLKHLRAAFRGRRKFPAISVRQIHGHHILGARALLTVALIVALLLIRHSYIRENEALREQLAASRSSSGPSQPAAQKLHVDAATSAVSEAPRAPTKVGNDEIVIPKQLISDGSERDDAFFGPKDAHVVLMLFSDFTCERCKSFNLNTLPKLKSEFADDGSVQIIYRDLPLQPEGTAQLAAQLAHCAGEQGAYWSAFDLLSHTELLSPSDVLQASGKLKGVDQKRLSQCVQSKRYSSEVEKDRAQALELGAKGAPGLFIARRDGEKLQGVFIRGAQPYPVIRSEILRIVEEMKNNAT